MTDHSAVHLRYYTLLMRAPQHGWLIMPLMQALIDRSIGPEGQLFGAKDCFATMDFAVQLANRYFAQMKPRGGSWAGAVRGQNNEMSFYISTIQSVSEWECHI